MTDLQGSLVLQHRVLRQLPGPAARSGLRASQHQHVSSRLHCQVA